MLLFTLLKGADGGSRVAWRVDVTELGGLLKAVPQGLIKAAAQKVITDAWTSVDGKFYSPTGLNP